MHSRKWSVFHCPPRRGAEATSDDHMSDTRNLAVSMKINLWTLTHGAPPNVGTEMQQAMERNYVFFTATVDAATGPAEVRAEPAVAGEPDAEPVSHYDTMMQHLRTVCPEWTDMEIADHIELMDADPFIDDVLQSLQTMD